MKLQQALKLVKYLCAIVGCLVLLWSQLWRTQFPADGPFTLILVSLGLLLIAASVLANAQLESLKRQSQLMFQVKLIQSHLWGEIKDGIRSQPSQPSQPPAPPEPSRPTVVDL